jgi:hypothetical protein
MIVACAADGGQLSAIFIEMPLSTAEPMDGRASPAIGSAA